MELMETTPKKHLWRAKVKKAVQETWTRALNEDASTKSSLRYLSTDSLSPTSPALVWSSAINSTKDTEKAFLKAKLITGTLRLQTHEAMFSRGPHKVDPTCKLCKTEPETRQHFMLTCANLQDVRQPYTTCVTNILHEAGHMETPSNELLMHLLTDPTHEVVSKVLELQEDTLLALENVSRNLITKLYTTRLRQLTAIAAQGNHQGKPHSHKTGAP